MVFFIESLKNKRTENEDSYCHMEIRINHEAKVNAFCVADGMGGLDAGKDYSQKAVSLWYQELIQLLMSEEFVDCSLNDQINALEDFSSDIFRKINHQLYMMGINSGYTGGTTLTTAIHFWDTWIIGNCGDSPVYMLMDGHIELISEIQNVAWQMVREKKTQVGSTLFYQNKNRLLEYLGKRDIVHPYVRILEDQRIQAILMGTDGAFGDLSMAKMESILLQFGQQPQALSMILQFAREHGENDNQTAVLIYDSKEKAKRAEPILLEEEVYREIGEESLGRRLLKYISGTIKGGSDE